VKKEVQVNVTEEQLVTSVTYYQSTLRNITLEPSPKKNSIYFEHPGVAGC